LYVVVLLLNVDCPKREEEKKKEEDEEMKMG